jgi:glycosyltransferase involved in cell wall biosynthesis
MKELTTPDIINMLIISIPAFLLIYSYLGYPLLLILASYFKERNKEHFEKANDDLLLNHSITVIFTFVSEDIEVLVKRVKNILQCNNPCMSLQILGIGDGPDTAMLTEKLNNYIWTNGSETGNTKLKDQKHFSTLFHSMSRRQGKTSAQNIGVKLSTGDIILFTDANSRFDRQAIKEIALPLLLKDNHPINENNDQIDDKNDKITRALPAYKTGITVGMLVYEGKGTENQYWTLENRIKALESTICTTIGANGALYGMRKNDYIFLPAHSMSDLTQPLLQLIINKLPSTFIQSAKVYEETPHQYISTYLRKKRITARALKSIPLLIPLLNPFTGLKQTGNKQRPDSRTLWACLFFVSHKVIRWATSLLILLSATGTFLIISDSGLLKEVAVAITLILATLKIVIHYKIDLPVFRTAAYVYLTLKAQLWAYYATIAGINTSVWAPLKDSFLNDD